MNMHVTTAQAEFDIASRFIELIAGPDASVWLRLIHDKDKSKRTIRLYGTLSEHWASIETAQRDGYGAFMVINEGGNKDAEITGVRAVFVDADNTPLPTSWHVPPDFIIQRDDKHWHAYWIARDLPIEKFNSMQKRLAEFYGTDKAICNASRVMRMPGLLHQKNKPTLVVLHDHTNGTDTCFLDRSIDELITGLPELSTSKEKSIPTRHARSITQACLMDKLRHIDPFCEHDKNKNNKRNTWLSVGGGLHNANERGLVTLPDMVTPDPAFDGLTIFTDWSAGKLWPGGEPLNYEGPEDCEKEWNGFRSDKPGGSTLRTIDYLSRLGGYEGSTDRAEAETFKKYADGQPGENVELGKPAKVNVLRNGSDIEIADAVLGDLKEKHGELVNCEGSFWHFNCFHWKPLGEPEMFQAIYPYDGIKYGDKGRVKLSKSRCESILHTMRMRTENRDFFRHAPIGINCKSGFIQFEGSAPRLEAHSPDHRQRHLLPGSWHPGAKWNGARLLNTFLEGCFGENSDRVQRMLLVAEIFGATALGITSKLLAPKAVVLYGPLAANGKSEFLKLARGLLPPSAVSALPPSKFNNDAMLAQLIGKLLNCADELGTTYAIASETFKAVVTGNEITARQLYRDPISFSPCALHIFATNVLPPFTGGFDRGVQRRLLPLEFTRVIPERERIPNIGIMIASDEADALLALAVEGAERLLQNRKFTATPSSRDLLKNWVYSADPVIAWLAECTEMGEGRRVSCKEAYADFAVFAVGEGYRLPGLPAVNNFVQRLTAQDQRIKSGGRTKSGRYLEGLRLLHNDHSHR